MFPANSIRKSLAMNSLVHLALHLLIRPWIFLYLCIFMQTCKWIAFILCRCIHHETSIQLHWMLWISHHLIVGNDSCISVAFTDFVVLRDKCNVQINFFKSNPFFFQGRYSSVCFRQSCCLGPLFVKTHSCWDWWILQIVWNSHQWCNSNT